MNNTNHSLNHHRLRRSQTILRAFTAPLTVWYASALVFALIIAFSDVQGAVAPREESDVLKTFTVQKNGTLDVSVDFGRITIHTTEKNEVTVEVSGIEKEDMPNLKLTQSGNTIRISYKSGMKRSGWRNSNEVNFDIRVPEQFNLEMRTSGGDIDIRGNIAGKVKGSTSGGDITGKDVVGNLDVSTSGGNLRFSSVSGDAYFKTAGGDIVLGDARGEVDMKTSGGNIRVKSVAKTLRAKTAGGDIEAGDIGGEAFLSTSGGNIIVSKVNGRATLSTAGGDVSIRGAKGLVSARTSGGNLRLEGVTGSIEGKTAGGDIYAELMPEKEGRTTLTTAAGSIDLYLPETAKAEIGARIRVVEGGSYYRWGKGKSKKASHTIESDFSPTADSNTDDDDGDIRREFKLNGGGQIINLETVMGSIRIMKLSPSRQLKGTLKEK